MSIKEQAETFIVPQSLTEIVDEDHAEIYAVRAGVRNSLRAFTERYAPLARLFRTIHIPAVNAEDVRKDEDAYISILVQRCCGSDNHNSFDDVRSFVQRERNKNISPDALKGEEEARYLVLKIEQYLRCGAYDRVIQIFKATPLHFHRDKAFLQFFVDSVGPLIFDHLRSLLIDRNASEFIEAYLKISSVLPCEAFDVSDICSELFEDEAFQCSLRKILGERIGAHPYIYKKTREYIMPLGILDDRNMESQPEIRNSVRYVIDHFAQVGPEAYMALEKLLIEVGLLDEQGLGEEAVLTESILSQLASYMKKSPRLYNAFCDRWENLRGVLRYEVNDRPEIRQALDVLLIQRIENHPDLYEHFRRMASFAGVDPYDQKRLKRTLKSKNESLQNSPVWLSDYSREDLHGFMHRHSWECDEELRKQKELSNDLLEKLEFVLKDYEKEYPHIMRGERSMLGRILGG